MPFAKEHIDKDGKVTDQDTRQLIGKLLEALVQWTRKLNEECA
jgi:hypothetical protein